MKKRIENWTVPYILLVIMVIVAFACRWPTSAEEQQTDLDEKTYTINPSTLLQYVTQGKADAFTLVTATPPATLNGSNIPVPWKQADYFFIAQSFHKFVWGESLDGWNLREMYFRLDCKDVSTGLQQAGLTFFKTKYDQGKASRLVRYINIAPRLNQAYFTETKYSPELGQWESIDLAHVKVSAEGALQIVERAAGSKIRIENGDNCYIVEIFDAGGQYKGWSVSYSTSEGQTILDINIDPLSGEYKVIR